MKRVAIIGAGAAGLASAKACREEDIEFVIFERTSRLAGLWNYHDDDIDGEASVMKTTVINSSKEMSAFSDFPPPKEFPNYMHNRLMFRYFQMYAEKFGLQDHIQYYHEVLKVVPSPDYDSTGRWIVTVKDTRTKTAREEMFDGVMVCTGHHGFPYSPKFPGQEDFKGKIVHTHSIKVPDAFKDQRVLIVGVGNSGLDAAVDVSNVAKQVYLSSRRGTWIMFRLGNKGLPADTQYLTRSLKALEDVFGWSIANAYVEGHLDRKFDHAIYRLRPKHRFNAQHLAINDHLPNKILSGTVILKNNIKTFTEKGVVFEEEEAVTKLDSVILATGYRIKFPFLSERVLDTTNNKADLYKYIFPPHLKHPTLAIIGLIQPFGSLFPIFEAQARWYALLMNNKVKFPSTETMQNDVRRKQKERSKRYVGTQRHTVQVDYVDFMDEITSQFGAKPNLLKMAFTDPVLFYRCFFGPCVPYQYRLQGPHSWPEARQTILSVSDRILCPLNTRKAEKGNIFQNFEFLFILYALLILLVMFFPFFIFLQLFY